MHFFELFDAVFFVIVEFRQFIQKKTNTNPRRGPFHHKSPSMMMWRTVRGMLPHKMPRGAAALARLKVWDVGHRSVKYFLISSLMAAPLRMTR